MQITSPKIVSLNNYPEEWNIRYEQNNYFATDPVIRACMGSNAPVTWSEQIYKTHRALYEQAKSFGLYHGWTQSSWITPSSKGFISFSRSTTPLSGQELDHKEAKMSSLARLLHACLSVELVPASQSSDTLSSREIEILKWIADGKTGEVIAQVLGITERTVTYHAVNIMKKMDVTNKTAAAVKAVLLGII